MQEKHSHFITIKAQSKERFENPGRPVLAIVLGKQTDRGLKEACHKN